MHHDIRNEGLRAAAERIKGYGRSLDAAHPGLATLLFANIADTYDDISRLPDGEQLLEYRDAAARRRDAAARRGDPDAAGAYAECMRIIDEEAEARGVGHGGDMPQLRDGGIRNEGLRAAAERIKGYGAPPVDRRSRGDAQRRMAAKLAAGFVVPYDDISRLTDDEQLLEYRDCIARMREGVSFAGHAAMADAYAECVRIIDEIIAGNGARPR